MAPLQGVAEAMTAIAGAARYGAYRAQVMAAGELDGLSVEDLPAGRGCPEVLDEFDSKAWIKRAGLAIPEGELTDACGAVVAAEALDYPLVAKLVSAALPHKSEAGAVRVGLNSAEEVANAVASIRDSVADYAPGVAVERFLLERMVADPVAELLVGVRRDPAFGQVMVLASGGVLVELLGDSQTLLLPTDRRAVETALRRLRVFKLLEGFRGRPAGDVEALTDAVLKLAAHCHAHRDQLEELDVNPLMVLPQGVVAVDALVRTRVP